MILLALFSSETMELSNQDKIRHLKRIQELDIEINDLLEKSFELRTELGKITTTYSDMPQGGGSIYSSTEIIIARIVDAENEVNRRTDYLTEQREKLMEDIDRLDKTKLKRLLKLRYIDYKTWEQVAVDLKHSWQHTHRLHSEALQKLIIRN